MKQEIVCQRLAVPWLGQRYPQLCYGEKSKVSGLCDLSGPSGLELCDPRPKATQKFKRQMRFQISKWVALKPPLPLLPLPLSEHPDAPKVTVSDIFCLLLFIFFLGGEMLLSSLRADAGTDEEMDATTVLVDNDTL